MVFSSFKHTLRYLYQKLTAEGLRVGLITGEVPDEQRRELRARFEADRETSSAIDVLLFSEVGCEGLDYQFCDCMINYDLPWNPMRIEQRIGRIDRNGKRSESVSIFSSALRCSFCRAALPSSPARRCSSSAIPPCMVFNLPGKA